MFEIEHKVLSQTNKYMEVHFMDASIMEIMEYVDGQVFAVWFLLGAALVFWMQAGFAMVEAGFTRAKNTGNIIMKNLMDFCIGCVVFILIGYGLLLGDDSFGGFCGKPNFAVFTNYTCMMEVRRAFAKEGFVKEFWKK